MKMSMFEESLTKVSMRSLAQQSIALERQISRIIQSEEKLFRVSESWFFDNYLTYQIYLGEIMLFALSV